MHKIRREAGSLIASRLSASGRLRTRRLTIRSGRSAWPSRAARPIDRWARVTVLCAQQLIKI